MSPPELAAENAQTGLLRCQFAPTLDSRFELAAENAQTGLLRCQFRRRAGTA